MRRHVSFKHSWVWWLLGGIALLCAGFQMWYFSTFIVDDAYISFRYAENFAHGHGLVFNIGEAVEGYTNFLWVVLLGLLNMVDIEVPVAARILGITTSVLTLWLTFLLSKEIGRLRGFQNTVFSAFLTCIAVLAVATSPAFGMWSVAGLETPLFACLLTAAIGRHIREEIRGLFPVSSVLFAIAALVRPEGVLYFGLAMFTAFMFRIRTQPKAVWSLWKPVLLFLPIVVAHLAWRWSYYHSIVPNTFHMKAGDGFQLSGIKYVYDFFLTYGGASAFLVCVFILFLYQHRAYWVQYLLLVFGVSILYFIYVGGDWMPGFRFFVPLLPVFFLCLQEGLRTLFLRLTNIQPRWVAAGVVLLASSILLNNMYQLYTTRRIETSRDGHVVIGQWLQQYAEPDDVLAAIDIGAMAYLSGLRTIDYFGLADRHIAHLTPQMYEFEEAFWGHRSLRLRSDTDYVLAQQPTFIELNTRNSPASIEQTLPADPNSALMYRDPKFQSNYHPVFHAGGTTIFQRNVADALE